MDRLSNLFVEIWSLLLAMSPYILFGLLIAGILHIIIPRDKIYKHFAKNNLSAVVKASLFGVPLPLCSCGVIPVAAHLRKEGAGKGSTLSFLISTPTTGVDSILATYSLLGPIFTVIRPVVAFIAGIFAGVVSNLTEREKAASPANNFSCAICELDTPHSHSFVTIIYKAIHYAFYELVKDIGKWLLIGIVLGGIIGALIPAQIVEKYLSNSIIAYILMFVIGLPMYVCATASIPIASALIMKGMAPGAGLIFLIVGPATNVATLSFIAGKLGRKSVTIYLVTLIITALVFGILLDIFWQSSNKDISLFTGGGRMLPISLKVLSSFVLLAIITNALIERPKERIKGMGKIFIVPDMTCDHCIKTITDALMKIDGIKNVIIDLKTKRVEVIGDVRDDVVISKIKSAGYSVEENIK